MPAPDYIKGYEKVLAAYSFWPNFHRAPARLIRVSKDRIDLELKPVHSGTEATADSHPSYRYRTIFSFTGLLSINAHAFGADNIIDELTFSPAQYASDNGSFIVDIESSMGCGMGGHLRAKNGEVILIEDIANS